MSLLKKTGLLLLYAIWGALQAKSQDGYRTLHFLSHHTSFPDTGRLQGHWYDSVFYPTAAHYQDSTVLLIVPNHLRKTGSIDLLFWFHGWRNNVDTAAAFYELTRQFIASGRNAVLVLAETARDAPDSYGGKLEQPAEFGALVGDVINALKKQGMVSPGATAGHIVLAGHSGAFRVIAHILAVGDLPVQEVWLFDALYSQLDKYMDWIARDSAHHFVHWFTHQGGGTDLMSDTLMMQLKTKNIPYGLVQEAGIRPSDIKMRRVLFVHSLREHNVIINRPDNFQLLLENSFILLPLVSKKAGLTNRRVPDR